MFPNSISDKQIIATHKLNCSVFIYPKDTKDMIASIIRMELVTTFLL